VQCDGQPHVCGPFNGRRFCKDLIAELRRLAEKDEPLPYYPQRLWFRALAAADAKDVDRFVQACNAAGDDAYFWNQHVCSVAASLIIRDGISAASIHRTSSGATRIVPEINEFKTPLLEDRRGNWQGKRKAERERIAAAANGNGQHAS